MQLYVNFWHYFSKNEPPTFYSDLYQYFDSFYQFGALSTDSFTPDTCPRGALGWLPVPRLPALEAAALGIALGAAMATTRVHDSLFLRSTVRLSGCLCRCRSGHLSSSWPFHPHGIAHGGGVLAVAVALGSAAVSILSAPLAVLFVALGDSATSCTPQVCRKLHMHAS